MTLGTGGESGQTRPVPGRRVFGRTGAHVSTIGQGTWQMEADDRKGVIAALRAGLDLGLTHIDTAELYGRGIVEELVGEAILGRRDEVFLVSKVLPTNASARGTVEACERSLKRLRTDRLDCYLLHWPGSHPLEDTIAAFERLERDGKIRSWGVSNFDVDDLEKAERIAGPGRIACNQVLYHLEERGIEHAVLPWCEARGVTVVGYSPFGSRARFVSPSSVRGRVLAEVAAKLGAARGRPVTPRQVALAFLVRRPSLLAIPKASRVEHVADNAGALDLALSPEALDAIERAFPLGPRRGLPTL
jgi:diketogulonate reductase-like aldo/keto reductase